MENLDNKLSQIGKAKTVIEKTKEKWEKITPKQREWWEKKIKENNEAIEKHFGSDEKRLIKYNMELAEILRNNPSLWKTLLEKAERI